MQTFSCLCLQSSPELLKLFGEAGEGDQDAMANFPPAKPPSRLGAARPGGKGGIETPRDFEEELTEEEMMRLELEKVKHERDVLMQSIMSARSQIGASVWRKGLRTLHGGDSR